MIARNPTPSQRRAPSLAGKLLKRANPYTLMDSVQYMRNFAKGMKRRQGWFLENLTIRKVVNMAVTGAQFALKSERLSTIPVAVKIDISPMCNLSCTVCVHADPNGNPGLEKQHFDPKHRMSIAQYRRIINRIKGRASAVSLYYLGDPLVHPDLDEMSRIAWEAGLNVHISTNFSFALSDARIKRIVNSGLTHLSVCVDGLSQEKYEMTRVGGRIDRVLHNLERVCHFRNEAGRIYPKVEVQYIKFQHNVDEVELARERLSKIGIDQFTDFWGALENYTDGDPDVVDVHGPLDPKTLPRCYWPYGSIVIKYNGDVIPCCSYRLGMQYTAEDNPRIFGNVFKSRLDKIWNSRHYREARRLVSDPTAVNRDPSLKAHFCYACPVLFDTASNQNTRRGNKYRHEDLYDMGPDGRPIRKDGSVTGLPDALRRQRQVTQLGLPNGETATV